MVEKKSKKKKNVKQIPAKAGAKAKVGSGGKVEVVLNTVRTVKDASRGNYKKRKKKNKKQVASEKQKDAIQLLREQIELEKLQALQRQSTLPIQQSQRIPNRRTTGDINQFFRESKNTGKTEVISDLAKEVKSLREELKKKDEKPVEKEKPKEEEKSKFKQELETTQNEIQRQRIQRGIARRDEEQREKNLQRQLEEIRKKQKTEQSRIRVATRKLDSEKTAREQAQRVSEEQFKRQESLKRAEIQRQDRIERQQPNTRPVLKLRQTKNPSFPPQKIEERKEIKKPTPTPEPEPTPQRFVVGGAGGTEVPFSSQEELLQAFRNRPNQPKPLSDVKKVKEKLTDAGIGISPRPLPKESEKQKAQRPLFLDDPESLNKVFPVPSSGSVSVPDEEPVDIDIQQEPVREEERKERRESFLQEVQSPEVAEPVLVSKLKEEAEKLRELQESGDKAYQDRLQAEIQIQEDERVARDLLYKEARKREFNLETQELDDSMRLLKEKKQREKKKARDNLRKREQEEFLDEVAGEIVRGATEQAQQRPKTKSIVGGIVGRSLANEIITATQNIPRSRGKYSQAKTDESIAELLQEKKLSSYTRRAFTPEEAKEFIDKKRQASDLKEKIALSFPEIKQSNYDKEMYRKDPNKDKLKKQIKEDMDKAKESGKYTGLQLVKLQTLLDRLVELLSSIKIKEGQKRDRRSGETAEEREERLRLEERARENVGGGAEQLIQAEDEDLNVGQAEGRFIGARNQAVQVREGFIPEGRNPEDDEIIRRQVERERLRREREESE